MPVQLLSETPVGRKVRLVAIDGGRELTRRLLSLGLTVGTEVEVLHHRGRGVVVGNAGNRVKVGRHLLTSKNIVGFINQYAPHEQPTDWEKGLGKIDRAGSGSTR